MAITSRDVMEKRGKYSYSWKAVAGDNPLITGKPDSSRVSRGEGYEVRDLINHMANKWSLKEPKSADKLEDMIHKCPSVMRDEVVAWVQKNWKTFKA